MEHQKRVLVADDEASIKTLLDLAIRKRLGYDVVTAANGSEALELMKKYEGQISVLVTDIDMPGMNGIELATKISEFYPATRIIVMTGDSTPEREKTVTKLGGMFIQKPFAIDTLTQIIKTSANKYEHYSI